MSKNTETPVMAGFGFDEDTSEESTGGKFITPGINDNLNLTDVYFDTEHNTLNIEMSNDEGKTVSRWYYDPSKGDFASDANVQKFNKVAKNLVKRYNPGAILPKANNFSEFCNGIVSLIKTNPNWNTVKVRTKVILNAQDYPTLPGYAPIWEDMIVPRTETSLKINPQAKDRVTPREFEGITPTNGTTTDVF